MKKKMPISLYALSFAYVMLTSVILFACNPKPQGENNETSNGDYTIKVIDSCEYIEYDYGMFDQRVYSLTHKGNCEFCAKRSKK